MRFRYFQGSSKNLVHFISIVLFNVSVKNLRGVNEFIDIEILNQKKNFF